MLSEATVNPRACALILDDRKMLLVIHRVKNGREYWVFPGGSVEHGESYEQAVIREVLEETTLIAVSPTLVLENTNAGRRERYFKFSEISGSAELGNGPEKSRLSESNVYKPTWVSLSEFITVNVQPVDIKPKVVAMWERGSL